jgi:hypothetical protein
MNTDDLRTLCRGIWASGGLIYSVDEDMAADVLKFETHKTKEDNETKNRTVS